MITDKVVGEPMSACSSLKGSTLDWNLSHVVEFDGIVVESISSVRIERTQSDLGVLEAEL